MFVCELCGKEFTQKCHLQRHQHESCRAEDGGVTDAKRMRIENQPSTSKITCQCCMVQVETNKWSSHCRTNQHKDNACIQVEDGIQLVTSAFKKRIATYRVSTDSTHCDYKSYFEKVKEKVIRLFEEALRVHTTFKCSLEVFGLYILPTQETTDLKSFNTAYRVVTQSDDLHEIYDTFVGSIIKKSEEFEERDSGK